MKHGEINMSTSLFGIYSSKWQKAKKLKKKNKLRDVYVRRTINKRLMKRHRTYKQSTYSQKIKYDDKLIELDMYLYLSQVAYALS